jgi:hypothetical protein
MCHRWEGRQRPFWGSSGCPGAAKSYLTQGNEQHIVLRASEAEMWGFIDPSR